MDPGSLASTTTNAPRKVRFAPTRRAQKSVVAKKCGLSLIFCLILYLMLGRFESFIGNVYQEFLDEEEFGEASESLSYDECSTKLAIERGIMGDNLEDGMIFLQLPASMPMIKQPSNSESNETSNNSKPSKSVGPRQKVCHLDKLPARFMRKLLVYRSGGVKLKLGDNLYDVSEGLDCRFAQDVVAVNTEERLCCSIGELNKRAIITLDVDYILHGMSNL